MEQYIGVDLHKQFFQACSITSTGARAWEMRFPRTEGGLALFCARCGPQTAVAVEACGPTWAFVDADYPDRDDGVCGRSAQDAVESRLRGENRRAGRAPLGGCAAARQRGERVCAAAGDSRATRGVPRPASGNPVADAAGADDSGAAAPQRGTRTFRSGGCSVPPGLAWLEEVQLPPDAAASLARLRHVLTAIHAEAAAAEAVVATRAQANPIARALDTMVGIGRVLALTLRAEVGDGLRFPRGAALASYAGLVPRVDASADRYWSGWITREGPPWLRWALVEVAMHAMRHQDPVGRWARQLAIRKGAYKARVALARRLCDEIVQVWRQAV